MSKFNLDTDFCRQCGCDSGWCDGCVKKKYYQQGRADAIEECIETIKKCYVCEIFMKLEQLKENL